MVALAYLLLLVTGSVRSTPCTKDCLGWARLALDGTELHKPLTELHYLKHQPANFTCSRDPPGPYSNVSVQLSYYSKETNTISTTYKDQDSVEMYMRLSRIHNDTLVTCSAQVFDSVHIVQVRLLQRIEDYEQGFVVTGLRLVAAEGARIDGERELRYQYRYMRNELMSVLLVWNRRRYAAVRCSVAGEHFPGAWQDYAAATNAHVGLSLTNVSLLPEQSNTELLCHARRVDLKDPFAPDLHLTLTFTFYELVPVVGGMAMWGVELLYIADNITTVYYDNAAAANGTHYLSCIPDPVSWWVWNPGEVDANPDRDIGENLYPRAFRMYDNSDWTMLQCVQKEDGDRPRRSTHVWLHQHRQQQVPAPVNSAGANLPSSREGVAWWWVLMAGAMVVVLVAFVATMGVKVWQRRARKQSIVDDVRQRCDPKERILDKSATDYVYEEIDESGAEYTNTSSPPTGKVEQADENQSAHIVEEDGRLIYETPYTWTFLNRPQPSS